MRQESATAEGDSPVREQREDSRRISQVGRDTRNPVRISGDLPARLNTPGRPIVNQYREGKVKRTPYRGVKKNLKPVACKRSEPFYNGDGVPFA